MRVSIGITGASGSVYADRLVEVLLKEDAVERIYLMFTEAGTQVCQHELKKSNSVLLKIMKGEKAENFSKLKIFANKNLFAPIASGSSAANKMVVVPCSMGTLSRIANGNSGNLVERSADVMLKQKRQLVLVPRETPLNSIHLGNMLKLSQNQVVILPPVPGFYQEPKSIEDLVDFVVGKILDSLEIEHKLCSRWNEKNR